MKSLKRIFYDHADNVAAFYVSSQNPISWKISNKSKATKSSLIKNLITAFP